LTWYLKTSTFAGVKKNRTTILSKLLRIRPSFWGVGSIFLATNFMLGGWLSRLPGLKTALDLGEHELGLALLGLPLGALLGNYLSGYMLKHLRTGQLAVWGIQLVITFIILLCFAFNWFTLLFSLFLVGIANGATNVAMNTAADVIERQEETNMMSAVHGMFSLGGFLGALAGGIGVHFGISLPLQLLGQGVLISGVIWYFHHHIYYVQASIGTDEAGGGSLSLPKKKQLILPALIGFCIMVGEGGVSDWGPIFLKQVQSSSAFMAALAYGGFSFTMAIGRFSGDRIRQRIPSRHLLVGGSGLGLAGLLIALISPWPWLSVVGFSLTGLGFSNAVPVLFSMAASMVPHRPDRGIAFMANTAVVGFLLAPPSIGFLAEAVSLTFALSVLAVLAGLAAVGSWLLRPIATGRVAWQSSPGG